MLGRIGHDGLMPLLSGGRSNQLGDANTRPLEGGPVHMFDDGHEHP